MMAKRHFESLIFCWHKTLLPDVFDNHFLDLPMAGRVRTEAVLELFFINTFIDRILTYKWEYIFYEF